MQNVVDALQDQFATVLDFVHKRKKGADELIALLKKRISAETQYSKAMQEISASQLALNQGY